MQELSSRGVVAATRGRQAGYVLLRDAERATMECFLGFKECSDETARAVHCSWRPVMERLFNLLRE